MNLFALAETSGEFYLGVFPPNFLPGLVGTFVYFLVALVLLAIGYKVIDFLTPGNLCKQISGEERSDGQPNVALGILAGLMFLGMCIIVAAAIH